MKSVKFTQANVKFVAEDCKDLHAYSGDDLIISCWELDGNDLMTILQTKRVWLHIVGTDQPPMMLSVKQPFDLEEP